MKQLLLTIILFFGLFSTSIAQKSLPNLPQRTSSARKASPTCPLTVTIQDNTPSAVCSELLKTLVAVSDPCTDTTAVSYSWSSSVGGVFSTSRTTTFNLPEFLVATPVTFTITAVEGTETVTANYTITVKPRPSRPSLTPFGTILICDNNPVTLTSSACTGGSTTIWSTGASAVSSISVPAIGGTYFKVACAKNGCVSDSTAAAALTTGIVAVSPTVTNRIICEGSSLIAGNGLQAQLVNCNATASGTYTYSGGTVGYDKGYINTGGIDPKVSVPSLAGNISNIKVSVTWRKQKGGYQNSCGVGDTESWPYHNETQFRVQSPSGKIITLVNTNTYGGSDNPTVTTVFEDGGSPINFYSPPVSGTFAPAQPLSGFIGENPTGTWTLLPYDAVAKDPLCVSGFQITFTADAQVGTLTWWDAPTGGNQVGTGSEFIPTNTTIGTYTYYAQAQCVKGCPSVRTPTTLTINPTPQAPVITVSVPEVSGVRNVCGGESITLTATGCSGTVRWNSSYNGTNFASGSPYTFVPSFSNSSNITQTFTAACEGANLCRSVNSNSLTVVVKQKPAQPTISGPGSTVCINSNVTLTASACSGGILGWTGNRSGSSINFVLTSAVNIKVACTVNGCTSDSSNVYSITTLSRPNPLTVNSSQVQGLCYGSSVTLSASTCAGTVKWTGNLTGSPITVTPLTSRSYKASCLGTNGCPGDSSTALTIVVLPKTKPTITGSTFICGTGAGIPVTLTATGCSGVGETVMWRNEDTGTTFTETISQTKTFRAVCIRGGFCVSDSSDIFTVQYRNKPSQPTITPPASTTICQGASASLTASACTGGTLGWTGGLSGSSISISSVGTKSYKVACTINGCTSDSSSAVTITVNPKPAQPTITSTGNTVCQGTNVTLTASACLNGTYGWTGGLTTSSITVSSVGTKSYKVACTVNGCTSDSSAVTTVQIKAKPSQPTITPPATTTICQGTSVSLTTSACTGGALGWTGGLSGQTVSVSPNVTKIYKVACTINGCTSDSSNVVTITVNPTPVISVSANKTSVCLGDTAILTFAGCTGSLSWSNGATTSVIKVSPVINTTYTATCTLGSCSANQSVSITALSTPNVTASGILQCGQTVTLTANNVPVGSSIQWRKDGVDIAGATNSTLVINSAGSYDFSSYKIEEKLVNGSSNWINSVKFISPLVGFMSRQNTQQGILKTTDGGNTWVSVYSSTVNFNDITFITPSIGFAVGTGGRVIKTTDGGNTWNLIQLNSNYELSKINFKDSNIGVIVGGGTTNNDIVIYYTNNQGQTWNLASTNMPVANGIPYYFSSVSFVPNTNSVLLTGYSLPNRFLLKSNDNGAIWNNVSNTIPSTPKDIVFTTVNNGWIVGFNGGIQKTNDGGDTWQTVTSQATNNLYNIQFINSNVGYIGGTQTLLKTTNGGNDWTKFITPTNLYTTNISFVNENEGWIGTYYGLYKYTTSQCSTTPLVIAPAQRPNAPTITPPTNSTICQGSSVTLSATGCTGGTYAWTGGLTGASISVNPSSTRAYKVACTLNTCTSDSSSAVTITVTPAPSFVISSDKTSICAGESATLTATGCTGTLLWSNNATTTSITVSPTANTTYPATCTLGSCSSNQSVSITALSTPNVTASGILQCGQTVTLTANNVPIGTSIQWRKDGVDIAGATNPTLVINSAGSYDFKVGVSFSTELELSSGPSGLLTSGVFKIQFIDNTKGFYLLNNTLKKTVDGGLNWTNSYSQGNYIPDVNFLDENTGWMLAGNQILKTTNGGSNWSVSNGTYPTVPSFSKILFRDNTKGIISCSGLNKLLITNDGGTTWSLGSTFNGVPEKFAVVPNTTKIFMIGNAANYTGVVNKSTDNGNTWTTVLSLNNFEFGDIQFINQNVGWVMGRYGNFYKTVDGGDTWTSINPNDSYGAPSSFDFISPQMGYLFGLGGIYKTVNGGNNWTLFRDVQSIDVSTGLIGVVKNLDFTSEDNGWYGFNITYGSPDKFYLKKASTPQCSTKPAIIAPPQRPNPPTITPPTNSTICQGSSVTLSATGCTGGTYAWTGGLTGANISVSPSSTRAYKVACTLNTCTSDSSSAVTINVTPKPTQPTINQINPNICVGQSTTLSVTPINGATYAWTGGLTGASISVSPIVTKTYKVVTTIAGCTSDSTSITVNVSSVNAPVISIGGEVCTNTLPLKVWDNTIALSDDDELKTVITTTDGGNLSVLGYLYGDSPRIIKTDASGNIQWSKNITSINGSTDMKSAVQTSDGGYLIGGKNNSTSIGGDISSTCRLGLGNSSTWDFWVLKIDANGLKQWDKRFGGNGEDDLNDLIKTSDGGYLLGGFTTSEQGGDVSEPGYAGVKQYWVVKVDANGIKQWDKRFATESFSTDYCSINSLLQTNDGGYLLGGNGKKPLDFNNLSAPRTDDFFIVKINSSGTKQWQALYDNNVGAEYLKSMQPTSDGGFILVGNTDAGNGNVWTVEINSSGVKQWDKQFGGTGNDQANTVKSVPSENNFLIAGSSTSGINGDKSEASKGGQDMWLIKIKADGTKIWDKTLGGDRTDYANSLAINPDGSIIVGGGSNSTASGDKSIAANQSYYDPLSGNTYFRQDSWLLKVASNCPPQSSAFVTLGDSLILKANPCTGTINWSNGMTGSSIVIKPTINTVYTATCSTTCTSPASSPFNVTVSTGICETIKSGSWTDPTTWSCNRVPISTDDVIINTGHTITNTGGTIRAKSLNYRGGQLQLSPTSNLILGN